MWGGKSESCGTGRHDRVVVSKVFGHLKGGGREGRMEEQWKVYWTEHKYHWESSPPRRRPRRVGSVRAVTVPLRLHIPSVRLVEYWRVCDDRDFPLCHKHSTGRRIVVHERIGHHDGDYHDHNNLDTDR